MSIIDAYIGHNPVDEVYLGSQLICGRHHPHTHAVLDEAQRQGFKKPLNINAFDAFVRDFIALGFLEKFDTYYLFTSDLGADFNFRRINLINPNKHLSTPYGGLVWSSYGVKGNGSNGYIDTNYNAAVDGVKFELNNASFGGYVFDNSESIDFRTSAICGNASNGQNALLCVNSVDHKINSGENIPSSTIDGKHSSTVTINRNLASQYYILADRERRANVASTSIVNSKVTLLRRAGYFSKVGLSTFHQGAALTLEENNQLDTLVDNYLKSINLNPII